MTTTRKQTAPSPGVVHAREVLKRTGLTYRQLDYWVRTHRVIPTFRDSRGSGSWTWWDDAAVERLRRAKERLDWGMTLDAALRHEDPPLPPPL